MRWSSWIDLFGFICSATSLALLIVYAQSDTLLFVYYIATWFLFSGLLAVRVIMKVPVQLPVHRAELEANTNKLNARMHGYEIVCFVCCLIFFVDSVVYLANMRDDYYSPTRQHFLAAVLVTSLSCVAGFAVFMRSCCLDYEHEPSEIREDNLREQQAREFKKNPLLHFIGRRLEKDNPEIYLQILNKILANDFRCSDFEKRLLEVDKGKYYMAGKQLKKEDSATFTALKVLAEEDKRIEEQLEKQREKERLEREEYDRKQREIRENMMRSLAQTSQAVSGQMNKLGDSMRQSEYHMITGQSTLATGNDLKFELARAERNQW